MTAVVPAKASHTRATFWREVALVALLATIFTGFAVAFWRADQSRSLPEPLLPALPLTYSDLHPNIRGAVTESSVDGALEFNLVEPSPMYPASVIADFARDTLTVSRRLDAFFPSDTSKRLRFIAQAPRRPTLGFSVKIVPIISLDFDRVELMKNVAGARFTFQDLLNSASEVHYLNETAVRYVSAFCGDQVAKTATAFCARERH